MIFFCPGDKRMIGTGACGKWREFPGASSWRILSELGWVGRSIQRLRGRRGVIHPVRFQGSKRFCKTAPTPFNIGFQPKSINKLEKKNCMCLRPLHFSDFTGWGIWKGYLLGRDSSDLRPGEKREHLVDTHKKGNYLYFRYDTTVMLLSPA